MASEYTPLNEITTIVDSTRTAFYDGLTLPLSYRMEQLKKLRQLISEHSDDIIQAEQADMYKRPRAELERTATGFCLNQIDDLLRNLSDYMKPHHVKEASSMGHGQLVYTPRGNVLIIGPWNFPTNLVIVPLAGAIAAGCTAIIKPSEVAMNVSQLLKRLIPQYLDNRAYKVVTGGVSQTSTLLTHKYDLIFFTGGPNIGKIIATAAAKHLTPTVLELGGKNPVVVDDRVHLDKVAAQITGARYGLNCGQVCTAPEYIILSEHRQEAFIKAMKSAIKDKFGRDEKVSTELSRLKNTNHFKRLEQVLKENRDNIVYGGDCDVNDLYVQPTIVSNANASTPIMRDEVFGPILTVFPVRNVNRDAVQVIQSYPKPLLMRIYSEDQAFIDNVVRCTDSGGVSVNTAASHFVVPGFPFGGSGHSGNGRYHGKYNFLAFSHEKPVLQAKL
eukprot:24383_1